MTNRSFVRKEKKRLLLWAAVLLCALLMLALPFAVGRFREWRLLNGGVTLEGAEDFALSAVGEQYPFAVELYERALKGEGEDELVAITAEAPILSEEALQPYLERYLEECGVLQAADWRQVWPKTREGRLVLAWYSPELQLYAGAAAVAEGDTVSCTAASIAYSELAVYGISETPQDPLPLDPTEGLSMDASGAAEPLQAQAADWRLCRYANKAVLWEEQAWTMHYDADGRGWLYRLDYATGKSTPACTVEGCRHEATTCGACFDVLRPILVDLGDRLLVSWYDGFTADSYIKSYACLLDPISGQRSPQIYLDRADLYNAFAANGKELLLVDFEGALRWMDLEGGWKKSLRTTGELAEAAFGEEALSGYSFFGIVDAQDGELLLELSRPVGADAVAEDGRQRGAVHECCLLRYDIESDTLQEVFRWQDSERLDVWYVQDGVLWRVDGAQGVLHRTALDTGRTESRPVDGLEDAIYLGIETVVAGRPVLGVTEQKNGAEQRRRFLYDPQTQTLQENTMYTFKKGAESPMDLMDHNEDWLCVVHEVVPVTITETVYGKPNSFVSDEFHYGFIKVEDLLANERNVIPLQLPE